MQKYVYTEHTIVPTCTYVRTYTKRKYVIIYFTYSIIHIKLCMYTATVRTQRLQVSETGGYLCRNDASQEHCTNEFIHT